MFHHSQQEQTTTDTLIIKTNLGSKSWQILITNHLIGQDDASALLGAEEDALLAFESGQLRVDIFDMIHQHQFGFRVGLVVQLQSVGV